MTAIIDEYISFSYSNLKFASASVAYGLLDVQGHDSVAFIASPSFDYDAIQWRIWRAGRIAV
jgi:hypothetical protein